MVLLFMVYAVGEVALYLTLYKAFDAANVTVAGAVLATYPIVSTVVAVLFLGEVVSLAQALLILLIVIGALVTGLDWNMILKEKLSRNAFVKGLGWVLICLCLHAIYFPALGNLTAEGSWETRLLGIKVFATIFLAIIFIFLKKERFVLTRKRLSIGFLIGFLEVLGWVGLSYGSNNSEGLIAVIVALGSSGIVITAIFAKIFLKEKIHIVQYFGILLVFLGSIGVSLVA